MRFQGSRHASNGASPVLGNRLWLCHAVAFLGAKSMIYTRPGYSSSLNGAPGGLAISATTTTSYDPHFVLFDGLVPHRSEAAANGLS